MRDDLLVYRKIDEDNIVELFNKPIDELKQDLTFFILQFYNSVESPKIYFDFFMENNSFKNNILRMRLFENETLLEKIDYIIKYTKTDPKKDPFDKALYTKWFRKEYNFVELALYMRLMVIAKVNEEQDVELNELFRIYINM